MHVPEETSPETIRPAGIHLVDRDEWQADIAARHHIGDVALANIQSPITVHDIDDDKFTYYILPRLVRMLSGTKEEFEEMNEYISSIEDVAYSEAKKTNLTYDEIKGYIESKVLADPKVKELIARRDISDRHEGLVSEWPNFAHEFTSNIEAGIEHGYIPEMVANRVDTALSKTSVRIIDGVLLNGIDSKNDVLAYHNTDRDEVAVAHDWRWFGQDLKELLTHEFLHKLSGGTFKPSEYSSNEYVRTRSGFAYKKMTGSYRGKHLNEAITEHNTQGLLNGEFETVDPDLRSEDDGTYRDSRKVLAAFIDRSGGAVDVKTITRSYFEDTGPDGAIEARRKLAESAKTAYGPAALKKLGIVMELAEIEVVNRDNFEDVVLNYVHPVELDSHGNVTKQGAIDISGIQNKIIKIYETRDREL